MQKHLVVLAFFALAACGPEDFSPSLDGTEISHTDPERWSKNDDPSLFGKPLNYSLRALPLQGNVTTVPWVGSYWPTSRDSINHRWDGPRSQSAAEKYGRAFGGGIGIEDYVSRTYGVDSYGGDFSCGQDTDCPGHPANYCGRRNGSSYGKCIPAWWGICDAWAAAAILTPEPMHSVWRNGVEFRIPDIKALVTLVHKSTVAKHIALRCHSNGVNVDGAGRPRDPSCRDANPGTYHVLLGNLVGLEGGTFIEDRSADMDVWNHPVVSYKITRMQPVNEQQANSLLGIGNWTYPYNDSAKRLVYIENTVQILHEDFKSKDGHLDWKEFLFADNYQYILELNAQGAIIGGEWVGKSKWTHPDFLWLPLRAKGVAAAGGAISYNNVMDLARASYEAPPTVEPSPQPRPRPVPPPVPENPRPMPEPPAAPVPTPEPPRAPESGRRPGGDSRRP